MDSSLPETLGHLTLPDQAAHFNAENPNPKTTGQRHVALGLNRTYASDWKVPDALRELYQNWETFIKFDHRKDAIVQTHQINPFDFLPHISATSDGITISVEDKRSLPLDRERPLFQQVLGYIRFNKVQGSAEFTNFGSNLDYRCLELGHTTKKKDHRLAGGHGEGLKIAALVLCRENHHVKISANSFHWHFGFNGLSKANFFCRLIPAKVKREPSAPSDTGRPAKLSAKIGEDVSVTIEKGQKGRPLSIQDFGAWMRDTIDLHPSSGRIRTPSGDLLLEPMYQGHMYLKGMRVPEPSLDGQAFRFGYNLTQGGVDRDRQRLVDPRQVTENIHKIWESAIAQTEGVALPRYLELFRHHPLSADARGADRLVAETTARRMWDALNYESKMGDLFYYSESHQNEGSSIIRDELKREPRPLPDLLWAVLQRYHLVREPMQELQSRFENSQEIELPPTNFANGLARTLRALLALEHSTRKTKVKFVRCETHVVDVAYQADKDLLYIHEKWLCSPGFRHGVPDLAEAQPGAFISQEIVEELYHRAMRTIFRQTKGTQLTPSLGQLLPLSHQKLHQMPRMIQVTPMADGETVTVSFHTGHSLVFIELYGSLTHYLVVLHGARCTTEMADLVYDASCDVCECSRQAVPLSSRTVVFRDVGEGPWVPMIAKMPEDSALADNQGPPLKAQDGALVGIPPQVVFPSDIGVACGGVVAHAGEVSLPVPPVATDQATELTAMKSVTAIPPVTSDRGSLGAPADEAVKMASIDESSPSDSFLPTTQTPAEGPAAMAPPPITVTADCENQMVSGDSHVDGVNGPDDPAPVSSTHAANLVQSSSAEAFAASERPGREVRAARDGSSLCTDKFQDQVRVVPRDNSSELKVDGAFQPCDDFLRSWKGKYVQVKLRASDGAGKETDQYIFYIHDVHTPTENGSSPQLVVTKYSFLVDHCAFAMEGTSGRNHELVLHFQDADRMAEESDAQIINVDDIIAVDTPEAPWTVVHVSQAPDATAGLFARYGVREGSQMESLFVAPLRTRLLGMGNQRPLPSYSPLPVASVFDLSPEDIGLSVGFARAGYRIRAALGFNENCHQPWKEQHAAAAVYPGGPESVIADLDSGKLIVRELHDNQAPFIVIISGGRQSPVPVEADMNSTDPKESLSAYLDGLRHCGLVAQSRTLSADFIVLTLSHRIFHEQFRGPLASAVSLLLGQGYSVTLKTLSIRDSDPYDPPVLLLAAPCGTNPQWIDDTISDLQIMSSGADGPNEFFETPTAGADMSRSGHLNLKDTNLDQSTQGSGIQTPVDDILSARFVGSETTDAVERDGLPLTSPKLINGRLHQNVAHQVANVVSRIIGEFSKRNQHRACSPVLEDLDGDQKRKKQRL